MNIGELFVTLGAKTDSSWKSGLDQIKQMGLVANNVTKSMGIAAKEMALSNKRAMADVSRSFNQVARDAERAAARMGAAFARENSRLMANRGMRSPGAGIIQNMRNQLRGHVSFDELLSQTQASGRRRPVSFSQMNAALGNNLPPAVQRVISGASAPGFGVLEPGGGRLRPFRPGSGGGMFGEGDPFAVPSGGGGGARPPRQPRQPRQPGGRGGRRRGFDRFGPLGELSTLRRVLYGAGVFQGVETFGRLADVYLNLQNRIRGVTGSQAEANATFERLTGIANRTRTGIESTAEAYVRIHNATETMNLSSEEQFKLIERINMALATSGATASEARSGMMQLTQALAKGKLDGDEFRSIAENMPNILKILEKSLHKTEGQLRAMSRAGQLTREKIVKAFLGDNSIEDAFNKTNATFGQTFEKFKTGLIIAFGKLAEDKDLVNNFAFALEYLGKGIILLVKLLGGVIGFVKDFVDGLKEGKAWAYALATVLGALLIPRIATLLANLLRLPAAFRAAKAASVALSENPGAAALGVGKRLARGAAGVGGAALIAASQGDSQLASVGRVGGYTLTGASLGGPWGAVAGAIFGAVMEEINSPDLTPEQVAAASRVMNGGGSIFEAAQAAITAGTNVNIGPTTVNIYAKDAKDAKEQFDDDAMKRAQRHAAAAFNRRGS